MTEHRCDHAPSYDDDEEEIEPSKEGHFSTASKATRFGSGQPSNRRGRPRVPNNRKAIIKTVASKRRAVTIEGQSRRLSYLDIVLHVIRNEAVKGSMKGRRLVEDLMSAFALDSGDQPWAVFLAPEQYECAEEWAMKCSPDGDFKEKQLEWYRLQVEEYDRHYDDRDK